MSLFISKKKKKEKQVKKLTVREQFEEKQNEPVDVLIDVIIVAQLA